MNPLDRLRRKPEAVIDVHSHVGIELTHYLTRAYPYGQSFEQLCGDGDRHGLDAFVVFPMIGSFYFSLTGMRDEKIRPAPNPIARFPYEFENERLLQEVYELFPSLAPRALPFCLIDPHRETQAQLRHIRNLRKRYQTYGFKIQGTIGQAPVRSLARQGKCFLYYARDENLPFLLHSSVHPKDNYSQAHDILDIAERNPAIRFTLAHECRFDTTALNRLARLPNTWFDNSAFGIHCDLAAQNSPVCARGKNKFVADYRRPEQVIRALAEAYPTKFIFGSDAPYYSYVAWYEPKHGKRTFFNLRSSMEKETRLLRAVPAPLRRRISHDNTLEFLTGIVQRPTHNA